MPISYLKGIVIVHGKSELQICSYIKQNLRLKIEIISDKNGEKSIQITSLQNILFNTKHKSLNVFLKNYDDVEIKGKGNKTKLLNFKIFIIMDTDDCTEEQKQNFINKKMFENHWAYEYIVPVYNMKNLEEVLKLCNIPYEDKKNYVRIFPTDKKFIKSDTMQIEDFMNKLNSVKNTNMDEFIKYCLNNKFKFD